MNRFNTSRIALTALVGGAAGFLNFVVQEPSTRASELAGPHAGGSALGNAAMLFACLGFFVGAALVIADELGSTSGKRLAARLPIGAFGGAICGAVAGLIGQVIFAGILGAGATGSGSIGLGMIGVLIVARAIGWMAVGAGIGLSGGLPSGSLTKCVQGLLGGAIGGAIGGVLFDVISLPFGSGTASRLVGDTAIGACVGAAVMLVEETAKVAWITVVAGRNEGKQYILSKPVTTIGRDELSDIPLFGDMTVAKSHATIRAMDRQQFVFADAGSPAGSAINGQRVTQAPLGDGDRIQIGSFQLLFSHRSGTAPGRRAVFAPPATQPYQAVRDPSVCPFCGGSRDPATGACACTPGARVGVGTAVGVPALVGMAGPYQSRVFPLDRDRTELGRDASSTIVLDGDPGVSRKHALVIRHGAGCTIQDLGSTNGTYVNGTRVQSAALNPGDVVHVGSSSFEFRLT